MRLVLVAEQLYLFNIPPEKVVNVAQVKHRSPFRYPGGKTWLVPRVYQWLLSQKTKPAMFIEPFAGGSIVGLSVAFEGFADHVTLVELDEQVASVWITIIENGEGEWLAKKIEEFDLTIENVNDLLSKENLPLREKAFQTIVQNRTSHGGILAPGAGLIKNGENGRGIASRWYPQTLAKRIRNIDKVRGRLTFIHGEAFDTIQAFKDREDCVFFIDPPYTAGKKGKRAGRRLYTHFDVDHEKMFSLLEGVSGDVLITYDNDEYVRELAERHDFKTLPVAMQNTHLAKMKELLIGKNLNWAK